VVKHQCLTTSAERRDTFPLGAGVDPGRSLLGTEGCRKENTENRSQYSEYTGRSVSEKILFWG